MKSIDLAAGAFRHSYWSDDPRIAPHPVAARVYEFNYIERFYKSTLG